MKSSAILKFSEIHIKNSEKCLEVHEFLMKHISEYYKEIKSPVLLISIKTGMGYVFDTVNKKNPSMFPDGMKA